MPTTEIYYLSVPLSGKSSLGTIRHWASIRMAYGGDLIWLTGFDGMQIASATIKTIPGAECYVAKNGKLHRPHSLLPERDVPSLLWTPIERALPVKLPLTNSNFFGITQNITPKLTPSDTEHPASAMMVDLAVLKAYICQAPAVRLRRLQWILFPGSKVLISGTPLLPLPGDIFWIRGNSLIPAGFDLEFPILYEAIDHSINSQGNLVVWSTAGDYSVIDRHGMRPLSISSFKRSVHG